ncbi:NitT/TauT family transport system substrate-binding protein [Ancylobacter aquaticus]|uniref:Thiamine pyrimidine synthase n=1 Tax=Ancylobacter aquaticus TaxID=100 RepID=A0A4R1IH98_ANCAQ|nr:ABC transporter substrate-binding protein [Ancylobacter aquaticus]TCK30842.1 NitT/TauT family transport system substrate-binding protein [Ancylobacter aquaticus]
MTRIPATLFAGALAACAALTSAFVPHAQAQELTRVTVVFPHPGAIQHFPIHVAIGEGYFKQEGLDVHVEAVDGSGQVLQALAAGQAQIGHPGVGPTLAARANGVDVLFIYNHFAKSQFGLVVKEEAAYKVPADLKGKIIGVGTADGAEVSFTRNIFDDLGWKEGTDYTFLSVGDGGMATAAFMRGDIDAYAGAFVDSAILTLRGMKLREITPDKYLGFFGNGYVTTRAYIEKNPKVIEGFGRAIVKATIFAMNEANTDTVLKHTTAGNPQEGEDKAFAAALLQSARARITPTIPGKGWGYNHPEQFVLWHEALVKTGSLKAPLPDLDKAYTNQFVDIWNVGVKP